jgi:arginine decarboxylase
MAWTHVDSESLYNVPNWGRGYFRVNAAGNVEVSPRARTGRSSPAIDLYELIGQIKRRGIATPVLLRFDGILRSRVRELNQAFNAARAEFDYQGPYRGVFPIKVNQQRHVVEGMLEEGRKHGTGLEVGSQARAARRDRAAGGRRLARDLQRLQGRGLRRDRAALSKLGIIPIIVIEKFSELATILRAGDKLGIKPHRRALQARRQGLGPLERFGRRPLEVRPDHAPDRRGRRDARPRRASSTASSSCTSTSAAR